MTTEPTNDGRFKYYLLNDWQPVRVTMSEIGGQIDAHTPDPITGSLVRNTLLMSKVLRADWVEDIGRDEFEKLCRNIYRKHDGLPPEPDGPETYQYFLLDGIEPVRVRFNEFGRQVGANTPHGKTGELREDVVVVSQLSRSTNVEKIDAVEFEQKCREFPTMKALRTPTGKCPS